MNRRPLLTAITLATTIFLLVIVMRGILSDPSSLPEKRPGAIPATISTRDDPEARAHYEWMRLHDPSTNEIPAGIRERELAFASTLPHALPGSSLQKGTKTGILSWTQRGPYNVGGRTRALAYDATDATIILAGGVSGGMWRSTDGGSSWTKTTGSSTLQSVTCLAQDTKSGEEDTWYYGTGESSGNSASGGSASYQGNGIYKSTDNGVSWTLLSSTASNTPQTYDVAFDYIHNIAVDPSDGEVYVAASNVILKSTNGGTSWTTVRGTLANNTRTDVAVTTGGVVYATLNSSVSTNPGIWRSTDGGTWADITPGSFPSAYGRVVIGIAPSNEDVVYFLAQGTNGTDSTDEINGHQLWKYTYLSGDGTGAGGTWVNRGANLPDESGLSGNARFDSQSGYDLIVRVKPDDEDFVVIGGTNLYRSTDGFATTSNWKRIGGYSGPATYARYTNHHPDQHSGMFKPGNSSVFLSGHDGGVSETSDITATTVSWTSLNIGYYTTQFYTVALDHGTSGSNTVQGGMQDNGTWRTTSSSGTANWSELFTGDGGYTAIADGAGSFYVSAQNSLVYRYVGAAYVRIDPTGGSGYLFINPYLLDPNDNALIYLAGGSTVWRNSDITGISVNYSTSTTSTNWTNLSNTSTGSGSVSALAASTSPSDILYYGKSGGGVYRLDGANSGDPTPTDITGGSFPSGYVSSIAVDPWNADSLMVVFSNYSVKSLWFSTDGGTSWSDVSGNLEENSDGTGNGPSCRWASILHGSSSVHFYVGTSTGLYSTTTLNGTSTTWTQEDSSGIGNSVVDMIDTRESDGTVVVATHGSGVFSGTIGDALPVQLVELQATSLAMGARLTWKTETELNNYGFDIERRLVQSSALPAGGPNASDLESGINWNKVGFVRGSGTSTSPNMYSFSDPDLSPGRYAYRIKQIDFGGAFVYTAAVELEVGLAPRIFSLDQNYPNPFNPTTTIRFTLPADGHVRLRIYDMQGRAVATLLDEDRKAGIYQQVEFDAGALASGTYFSRLEFNGRQLTKKLLLVR